jgi:MarR family transcriptional regulator, organic hydroperoxide resistance regulator
MKTKDVNELSLDEQLCFALYRASQTIIASYRQHLAKVNLTYTQYLVMLVLWESGSLSIGQISHRLGLDSGTLTPLVKRLEQRGLVSRDRALDDERVVVASLTEAGRALREPALAARRRVAADTGLSREALAHLREDLHRLSDYMET